MAKSYDKDGRLVTPLDSLNFDLQAAAADDLARFETQVVELLFQRFKLPAAVKQALYRDRASPGDRRCLLLEDFYGQYPGFPVRLVVKRYRQLSRTLRPSSLFLNFGAQPFVKDFEKQLEVATHPVQGIVHAWPYIPQGMVIHNYPTEATIRGGRFCYTCDGGGFWFWEPLSKLVASISWLPEKE